MTVIDQDDNRIELNCQNWCCGASHEH